MLLLVVAVAELPDAELPGTAMLLKSKTGVALAVVAAGAAGAADAAAATGAAAAVPLPLPLPEPEAELEPGTAMVEKSNLSEASVGANGLKLPEPLPEVPDPLAVPLEVPAAAAPPPALLLEPDAAAAAGAALPVAVAAAAAFLDAIFVARDELAGGARPPGDEAPPLAVALDPTKVAARGTAQATQMAADCLLSVRHTGQSQRLASFLPAPPAPDDAEAPVRAGLPWKSPSIVTRRRPATGGGGGWW